MKALDLVRLINEKPYVNLGIGYAMHGIVINTEKNDVDVMFFNPHSIGDYIIVKVNANDLALEDEKLPKQVQAEVQQKLEWLKNKTKHSFFSSKFKNYDYVELINDEDYKAFGIKNGDIGCIMDCTIIDGCVLAYFDSAEADEDGFIDSISIKVEDLRLV